MKKLISGLLALGFFALGLPAFAAVSEVTAVFDAAESTLTVSGNSSGSLMVIVPKNSSTDIPYELEDIEDVSGKLIVFGEAKSENGTFTKTFPMPTDQPDGNYTVYVCSNDMTAPERVVFRYISEATLKLVLDDINLATADNIISLINTYNDVLGLDISNLDTTDAANIILARPQDGFTSPEEVQAGIDKGYALTIFNLSADAATMQANIESFKDALGLDLAIYANIGTDGTRSTKQLNVCEDMLAELPVTDITAFCSELNSVAMWTDIKTAEDWAYLRDMLTDTYKNQLTISDTTWNMYARLIDSSAVFKNLYANNPTDIESALAAAVSAQYALETKPKPSGNGGGGGGGGASIKPSAIVTAPTVPDVEEDAFDDLDEAEWAKDDITALKKAGILSGDGTGNYYPNRTVTREELVTMVVKAFGYSETADMPFEDVNEDAWYAENIAIAFQAGIISGVSADKFGIGMPITRQDLATILFRCAELEAGAEGKAFSDEDEINDYAKEAVSVLSGYGVINGIDGSNFGPRQTATRAQVAVMLNRLLNVKEGNADA